MPSEEHLYTATNRLYEARKGKQKPRYILDEDPLRLRGYTEIRMNMVSPRHRKLIDSALRRGYTLQEGRVGAYLRVITDAVPWRIGYVGRTRAHLWMPTEQMRDELYHHIQAQLVITEKFPKEAVDKDGSNYVSIYVNAAYGDELKAHMTEARLVIDEHMKKWRKFRIDFAKQVANDDYIARKVFDSHYED